MKKKKSKRNDIKINKFVILIALFLFAIMIVRTLQIALSKEVDGTDLQALASRRTTKTEVIKANRGTIYTAEGEVLAQNVSSYKLIAYLSESRTTDPDNPQHVVDKDYTAEALAPILGISKEEILRYLNREGAYQVEFGNAGKGLTELKKESNTEAKAEFIKVEDSDKYIKLTFNKFVTNFNVHAGTWEKQQFQDQRLI